MAERGIVLPHPTIQRYVPDFEKRWNGYAPPVGESWRVDANQTPGAVAWLPHWSTASLLRPPGVWSWLNLSVVTNNSRAVHFYRRMEPAASRSEP